MKRLGAFALVLAVVGCSTTEKQAAPTTAPVNPAPAGVQQTAAVVPSGTTGTGSYLVSGSCNR
ncbi:MAG: hypothetical protein J0I06_05820 [Planctomycetes bacterium]|nr:hypothetical protein [Planctomycetota bacterium]